MIRALAFSIAAILPLAQAAAAQPERPALRAEATVTGNVVRIGDLVDNAGIVADVAVFRAPALGETGTVPVALALEAMRAHALVGLDPGSISEIAVTRASRAIAANDIEALVAEAVAKGYGLGQAADVAVGFDRALRTIRVEPSVTAAPRIEQLRYDARSGRFEAELDVPGAPAARQRLTGTAVATAETVTLTRPLARGEIIKMGDLAMRRLPRDQIGSDTITDPDQAIGLAARNPLNSGRALRAAEVMKPEIVHRGENVTIIYQVPGIVLAVRGKAVDSGAEGDMVDIVNVQSNRTVRGTIIGPAQVAVASMAARVIASADASLTDNPGRSRTGEK
jgi:flagella basal body P-ring formation protein FlgA